MQNRFKSPVFWTTLIITIIGVLVSFGAITQDLATKIVGAVTAIASALFGIANNPTDKEKF